MPSRFRVRGIFRPVVLAMASRLARTGMTPNQATWTMLACSLLAAGGLVALPWFLAGSWIFAIIVFITGLMDGVDGSIARLTNNKTRFGAVLDSSMDRISDAVIFLAPAVREMVHGDVVTGQWLAVPCLGCIPAWAWCLLAVTGAYMTSYVRARVSLADPDVDMDVGLLGRSERMLALVVGSAMGLPLFSIIVIGIMANGTAVYRLHRAKHAMKEQPSKTPGD